ncbi:uncharacterized protein si:ch211-152c8.2 [Pseudoliparis swirei]|uniref:uncharacterized protein si:ch211-152c8.2 n=1 Tax=Pseudoliparis swirei TaxID=2059687 RepID=UPI0024BF0E15|nr:uncharacterized protein si:ch211-152c8.2 [Pseudoliparis swirei]
MVPIFKNKCPSRLVNVALLRLQKQRKQLIGGGGGRGGGGRVTLPAVWMKTSAAASSSSVSSLPAAPPRPLPPPLLAPRFHRRPKPLSLSPAPKSRPGFLLAPETETTKPKSRPGFLLAPETETTKPKSISDRTPGPPPPETSMQEASSRRVEFESKPKKPRSAVRDVDVGQMARSSQLSKVNSATLLSWLKGRGVLVSTKHRKEELMLKVMSCLAEA